LADQNFIGEFELFTTPPDGGVTDVASGPLVPGGNVLEFKWALDSSGLGYIADQDTATVEELFASQPDGVDNTLISGVLVSGGDVLSFDWVP
jgi:hypothetical protein